jgi:hypothetical protein
MSIVDITKSTIYFHIILEHANILWTIYSIAIVYFPFLSIIYMNNESKTQLFQFRGNYFFNRNNVNISEAVSRRRVSFILSFYM